MGIPMGGYGAVLLAERYLGRVRRRGRGQPAVWTSYPQARQANPGAFASAAAFAADDVITHAAALGRRPVRIASGHDDPFYSGRPGARPRPPRRGRCGLRSRVSRRLVLRRAGTPLAGLPG